MKNTKVTIQLEGELVEKSDGYTIVFPDITSGEVVVNLSNKNGN